MNHSNLTIIVDAKLKHPYGVYHRLAFFAQHAGKKLVRLPDHRTSITQYAVQH